MRKRTTYEVVPVASVAGELTHLRGFSEAWFCLTNQGQVLTTPEGIPIAHPSRPLLEGMRAEALSRAGLRLAFLSLYSMFCTMRDHVEPERTEGGSCKYLVLGDLTLRLCAGPEAGDQLAYLGPIEDFFSENHLPRLQLSQSGDASHQEQSLIAAGCEPQMNTLVDFFETLWPTLSPAQQCVVTTCVHIHGVFILGILLAQSRCDPAEYADALLALDCLIPGVFGVSQREAARYRKQIATDAMVMARFRDLAEG